VAGCVVTLKKDIESSFERSLEKGMVFKINELNSDGDAKIETISYYDYIRRKDFGQLEVSVVVAWPSVQ